jgi:hypothetical protein
MSFPSPEGLISLFLQFNQSQASVPEAGAIQEATDTILSLRSHANFRSELSTAGDYRLVYDRPMHIDISEAARMLTAYGTPLSSTARRRLKIFVKCGTFSLVEERCDALRTVTLRTRTGGSATRPFLERGYLLSAPLTCG